MILSSIISCERSFTHQFKIYKGLSLRLEPDDDEYSSGGHVSQPIKGRQLYAYPGGY